MKSKFFDFPSATGGHFHRETNDRVTTMYTLRPIIRLPTTCPDLKTMYETRNIHEDNGDCRRRRHNADTDGETNKVITEQKPLFIKEYNELESRQEKILNQLVDLKKQVSALCTFLKQSNKVQAVKDHVLLQDSQAQGKIHLVMNVDPSRPPFSILALQKLWKDTDIRIESYTHSNNKHSTIPIHFRSNAESTSNYLIHLSLIWKEVYDLEVITNTFGYPIIGEVNFLRYMSRLIKTHDYENVCMQPHVIDRVLDTCSPWPQRNNLKMMQSELHELASELDRWSSKDDPNIADVAVWSMIKQLSPATVPQTLKQWYKSCENIFINKTLVH